ncbi:MAG: bifunctional UDP-sugar hydrolase/5'-nucleotidase [Deltaproteobacteria bacterium]|nr:bifunctional UDP-sugar hydrolase/5'-nucleotidase [Deltaproteobacteria bacterium]
MKRFSKIFILLFILVFLFPLSLYAEKPSFVDLTILHVNDTHGRIQSYMETGMDKKKMVSGAAYLAGMIKEERSKNPEGTLLLSAGDMFQGTPVSNLFKGQPVIDVMNYLRFDAMAVGNHEFDWGMEAFKHFPAMSNFPYLSANIKDDLDQYLPGVKPYIIVTRKSVKIAIIGFTTPEVLYVTKPGDEKRVLVYKPEVILPHLIDKVKDEGAAIIIVLSHLGVNADKELARGVSGVHVIVGGHSHTPLATPIVVGDTIIVQAGCNGLYLGILKLRIDTNTGMILQHTEERELRQVIADKGDPYDEETAKIVQTYYGKIQKEFARVVGETSIDLVRHHQQESNVGNLVCDAMKETTNADIAFLNSGGIRTNIPRGKITMEQVFTLLPFDDALVTMNLTGEHILEILERSAKLERGILQVSGIKIRYDLSEPAGSRIKDAYVESRPLDRQKTYTVTTVDFLADGGDAFSTFKKGKNIVYGMALRDVFVSYLKKHSPVSPRTEERIIISIELKRLKLHDEQVGLSRVNLFDLQPQLNCLFRFAREKYKPMGDLTGPDGTVFEGPLFQIRPDSGLDIRVAQSF